MSTARGCELPVQALHRAFDGEAMDAAVQGHVASCPVCAERLAAWTSQRDALTALCRPPDAEGRAWRAAALTACRTSLADLVQELAGACLGRSGREARQAGLEELPRTLERVLADLQSLVTRIRALDLPIDCEGLPEPSLASGEDRMAAAACVELLRRLEGDSPRVQRLAARCDDAATG